MTFESVLLYNAWGFDFRRDVFLPLSEDSHVELGLDSLKSGAGKCGGRKVV